MKLQPSMREKIRYVAFKVDAEQHFDVQEVQDALKSLLIRFVGEQRFATLHFSLIANRWKDNTGIARIHRKHVDVLRAAFCLLRTITKKSVLTHSIRVSGMINKL